MVGVALLRRHAARHRILIRVAHWRRHVRVHPAGHRVAFRLLAVILGPLGGRLLGVALVGLVRFILFLLMLLLLGVALAILLVDLLLLLRLRGSDDHSLRLVRHLARVRARFHRTVVGRFQPIFDFRTWGDAPLRHVYHSQIGEFDEVLVLQPRRPRVVLFAKERHPAAVRLRHQRTLLGRVGHAHPQRQLVHAVVVGGEAGHIERAVDRQFDLVRFRRVDLNGRGQVDDGPDGDQLRLAHVLRCCRRKDDAGRRVLVEFGKFEPHPRRLIDDQDARDWRLAIDLQRAGLHTAISLGRQCDDRTAWGFDFRLFHIRSCGRLPA